MMAYCLPRVHRTALESTQAARKKEVWLGIKGDKCQFDWRGRNGRGVHIRRTTPGIPDGRSTRLAAAIAGPRPPFQGPLIQNHAHTLLPNHFEPQSHPAHDSLDQSLLPVLAYHGIVSA